MARSSSSFVAMIVIAVPLLVGCNKSPTSPSGGNSLFINIINPPDNATISGTTMISLSTNAVPGSICRSSIDGASIHQGGCLGSFRWTPSPFPNGPHMLTASVIDYDGKTAEADRNIIVSLPTTTQLVPVASQSFSDLGPATGTYFQVGVNVTDIPFRGTTLQVRASWNEPSSRCIALSLYELANIGSGPGVLVEAFPSISGLSPVSTTYSGYNGRMMFASLRNCSESVSKPISGVLEVYVGP